MTSLRDDRRRRFATAGGSAAGELDTAAPPGGNGDDAEAFAARVARHGLFAGPEPVHLARAPGRFDVLGGIADYSGALVLALPIRPAALVAAQLAGDGRVLAVSDRRRISLPVDDLLGLPVEALAHRLSGVDGWAAYVLGPVALLLRATGSCPAGLRILVSSSVPEGKGLGSSAAIEVATLQAVAGCVAAGVSIEELVLLAHRAEQTVAGAPCGAMDQTAAARGEEGRLLALLCRPAEVVDSLPLPAPLTVWGIDSGTAHTVAGQAYRRVRSAAFIGRALLQCEGYLAELDPSDVDLRRLPEHLTGREFLRLRDGVDDPFSSVEHDAVYPVRAATLHPVEEHLRVRLFAELIGGAVTDDRALLLGELMHQSHRSYSRCGIGTPRTDAIVDAVRGAGWERGLVGARVSGGGSGGTVVVLGRREAEPLVAEIAERLGAGYVRGSSSGAAIFGSRVVTPGRGRSADDPDLAVALAQRLDDRGVG